MRSTWLRLCKCRSGLFKAETFGKTFVFRAVCSVDQQVPVQTGYTGEMKACSGCIKHSNTACCSPPGVHAKAFDPISRARLPRDGHSAPFTPLTPLNTRISFQASTAVAPFTGVALIQVWKQPRALCLTRAAKNGKAPYWRTRTCRTHGEPLVGAAVMWPSADPGTTAGFRGSE